MKKRKVKCNYPIQKSFPKQKLHDKLLQIKEVYICIWPANPNVKDRVSLDILYKNNKQNQNYQAEAIGVALKNRDSISLLFDKTGKELENSPYNFLFMQKGSCIQIDSSNYIDGYYLFDRSCDCGRRKYFKGMLDNLQCAKNDQQLLVDYINYHFPNIKTFSFAVYLKVKFYLKHDSCIFENDLDIPIWSVLVFGETDSKKSKRTITNVDLLEKLPAKAIVETPDFDDQTVEQCTAEDLGMMRRSILAFIKDVHRENEGAAEKIIDGFIMELAELKNEMGLS